MICDKCKTKMDWDTIVFCPKCEHEPKDSVTVKTARIDEIIKFINTDFKYYDNRGHAKGDLIEMLENLKKG